MVKVNKDTIMIKIEGSADAYYSGASAYGSILVPKSEVYMPGLESLSFSVSELDGKHSETEGEIKISEGTLEQFVNEPKSDFEEENDYFDYLLDNVIEILEDINYNSLEKMSEEINKLSIREEVSVKLTEDLVIEGEKFPKGVILTYSKFDNEKLTNFEFELEKEETEEEEEEE